MPFPGQKCGGVGEPACPPIECITVREGVTYITIEGVEHILTPVMPDPEASASTEGVESNTAPE